MRKLNVLVACEESQRVCAAFRELGHNAYSCDVQEPSGGHPEWHIKGDVTPILNPSDHGNNVDFIGFETMDKVVHTVDKWDLIIAHPPCTYLTNSGSRWFDIEKYGDKARQRYKDREKAVEFFMQFVNANCKHIAIENPVGHMSSAYRKPDCIYNPYDFIGETECKKTCLWLKGLKPLKSNRGEELPSEKRTHNGYKGHFGDKCYGWNDSECSRLRSQTPIGVARAMAEQWSSYLMKEVQND